MRHLFPLLACSCSQKGFKMSQSKPSKCFTRIQLKYYWVALLNLLTKLLFMFHQLIMGRGRHRERYG